MISGRWHQFAHWEHRETKPRYHQRNREFPGINLRTPSFNLSIMRAGAKSRTKTDGWSPLPDPAGRFSSGIPDFDRLLSGGFRRGSEALFMVDETIGLEDLDLLLFPTFLNFLYQSRGMLAILPSNDSPHGFRSRLTQFVTRRRFDTRVRVMDYIGEDQGLSYVVTLGDPNRDLIDPKPNLREKKKAIAKVVAAEKAAQGGRGKPIIEFTAFEVFDTLLGSEKALKMFFYGIKRVRGVGNLGIGISGPGLGCAAGVRRLSDSEFALHRDDVGLMIRGVRPRFPTCVVTEDRQAGPPHVAFVPRPPSRETEP